MTGLFTRKPHRISNNIELVAWYLTIQYPNIKSGNQRRNKQKKADDPKSEDKNNTTIGTAGAHVDDNTTNEDTTALIGEANLGAHVSIT